MKKIVLILGSVVCLAIFMLFSSTSHFDLPEPDATAHQVINDTVLQLQEKYELRPFGTGFNGKFKYMEISFQLLKKLDKEEARTMLIDCVDTFVANINANETLKPYLDPYPFTRKNAGIVFYISKPDGYNLFHPDICVAESTSRGITFRTDDPEKKHSYKEVCEETHEEAITLIARDKAKHIATESPKLEKK